MQTICQAHLREIDRALRLYAYDCGAPPAKLEDLITRESLEPRMLQCPAAQVNSDTYVYIADRLSPTEQNILVVYERTPNHAGNHNALIGESDVEVMSPEALTAALTRTQQYLAKHAATRPAATQRIP